MANICGRRNAKHDVLYVMKNMYLKIIQKHTFIRVGTCGGDDKNVNIRDDRKRDKQTKIL